jgi:hypothetical protein
MPRAGPTDAPGMNDPRLLGVALIGVAAAAVVLRVLATRQPELRPVATIASLAIFAILALLVGLVAMSIFRGYAGAIGA